MRPIAGLALLFAAGDVRRGSMTRVATAVGEGAMAIRLIHEQQRQRAVLARHAATPPAAAGAVTGRAAVTSVAGVIAAPPGAMEALTLSSTAGRWVLLAAVPGLVAAAIDADRGGHRVARDRRMAGPRPG